MTPSLASIELLLKVLAIQAVVLSVLFFVRRMSAATQHLWLSASVVLVLLLTVISPLVPSRQLGLIPISETGEKSGFLVPQGGSTESSQPETARGDKGLSAGKGTTPATGNRFTWSLGTGWVLGTSLILLWMSLGLAYSWLLSRRTRPHTQFPLQDQFRRLLAASGLPDNVSLGESDKVRIPVVFGFFRPRVILPVSALEWSEERLNAVLLHESAHILRRDLIIQFMAKLTCALYWFNPFTWLIERKLFLAGERAADDHVIRQKISPADYAEHLMEASAELGTQRNPIWATAAMAEGTAFKDRILSIMDPNIRRGEPTFSSRVAVTLAAVALATPLLAFSPWNVVSRQEGQTLWTAERTPAGEAAFVQQVAREQGIEEDLATLIRMLRMADPGMREHAATALGETGNEAAVLPLIDVVLNDRNADVREHACTALGILGDKRAVAPLSNVVLHDTDPGVREHAAAALEQLREEAAVLPLIDIILTDQNAGAREHASTALGILGDERAVKPLTDAMLRDADPGVREHAASALGLLKDRRSFEVLLQTMLGADEMRVRAHAASALGMLGDSRALNPLLAALSDPSPAMRMHAAMGLGELGDSRAVDALNQALYDPDEQVRFYAREALRKIREGSLR